jgi:hypothetical protein
VVRWTRQETVALARSVSIEEARRHFFQKPLTWIGFGVAAVVLAVAGLFGGLEERRDATAAIPPIALGEAVDAGPWRISVERAFTIDELDGEYLSDEEANHWFGLVATVTVIDDEPNEAFAFSLQLAGAEGLAEQADGRIDEPAVVRFDDASPLALNPGITEQVVYLWEQSKSAAVPATVTVEVLEPKRRRDSLSDELRWFYSETTTVGAVSVPVEQLPTADEE